ncbi:Tryptophan-rich sensory protein (benzodiazepine receptor homolog) [Pedococcus dokdonensis]|uniref:Tryptophan-rich sensory protein (Benzodiazepine receptor homolog) n=1 Tax=Pedococcus dokdonensis TaxID=443156 RepID=A0A1H0KXD5_9MICO|nr:tryptophan-rich sensory protein [Pedococcus dokdonensis]SDO60410.1 Tryptophan-rich sensory protein (benzodiazepine receptor homolog) [Pedococcus dokdonensis]
MTDTTAGPRTALVTGATGYIGGQLVPALLDAGWQVRVLTRKAAGLHGRPWQDDVEVVTGDATSPDDLGRALEGVEVAYYLLHSMDGQGSFVERDRTMAQGFAAAAADAGTGRLVYLSGLHPSGELSEHLASRVEVGEIFLAAPVPATVLQAGVVLGDGSASFDMLRHLTERLPAMVAPKWVDNRIQPIAVDDVVHYLVGAADLPRDSNRTFDIGGPEVLTYAEMMQRYARVAGLGRRLVVSVPVLTPRLAGLWVGLVTPISAGIARPLVGSLVHEAICHEDDVQTAIGEPPGGLRGFDEAVRSALRTVDPLLWRRTVRRTTATVATAAVVGSALTDPGSRWYAKLDKPAWQPPPAAFPVVWTGLYAEVALLTAAASSVLAERDRPDDARNLERALAVNMVLNAGWTGLFFRAHRPWVAAAECAALTASSVDLARRVAPAGRGKATGLLAYAGWCAFATALTTAIARRNPRH